MVSSAIKHRRPALTSVSIAGRRLRNEDRAVTLSESIRGYPVVLLAVADGMGGHTHGELASRLACDALKDGWQNFLDDLKAVLDLGFDAAETVARAYLSDVFVEADRRIARKSEIKNETEGMGTTLVIALSIDSRIIFANVGDSRGYIIRRDEIEQITQDHSVVEDAMRRGMMSEKEAEASVFKHALTRSIDGGRDSVPDLFPETGWYSEESGFVALLCSDGLYGPLTDLDLFEHVTRTENLETASRALVWKAIEENGQDNVTIVAAEWTRLPRASDMMSFSPKHLSAILSWAPEEYAVTGKAEWWLRVGALSTGMAILVLLIGLFWYSQSRPINQSSEARTLPVIDALGDGSIHPTSLSWTISGEHSLATRFVVSVTGPPDSLTNQREVVHIETTGSTLAFSKIEQAWSGEVPTGNFRWSVAMLTGQDTVRSDVSSFSIPNVLPSESAEPEQEVQKPSTESSLERPARQEREVTEPQRHEPNKPVDDSTSREARDRESPVESNGSATAGADSNSTFSI